MSERRIVSNFFISLDGVVESPDQWHFQYFDEQMGQAVQAGFAASDALLMGGTVYREWSDYWPKAQDEMATVMNAVPKYVVSRTLESADWSNSTLIRGDDPVAAIRDLKAQPGKDIAMSGSATLVRWLLREGLLDELNLLVHPVVVGSGKRLFPDDTPKQPLELVSADTFESGVLHLVYRPAAA